MPEGSAGISGDRVRSRDTRAVLLYNTSIRGFCPEDRGHREGLLQEKEEMAHTSCYTLKLSVLPVQICCITRHLQVDFNVQHCAWHSRCVLPILSELSGVTFVDGGACLIPGFGTTPACRARALQKSVVLEDQKTYAGAYNRRDDAFRSVLCPFQTSHFVAVYYRSCTPKMLP